MLILLTGSTGMVGRNFLEHPEIDSFDVLAPSRAELDLFNYQATKDYLAFHKPDIIIHAAGRVGGIQVNIGNPAKFLVENLDMGRNIVCAAHQTGITKVINLGSSCMYPRNAPNPLKEDNILQGELEPTNEGYALAKIMVSRLCEYITRENQKFQYKTVIPCNLYGRWDKFDISTSHLIPAVIRKVYQAKVGGVNEVTIWGDGLARREFMYAADFADFLVYAVKHFDDMPNLINVGLGFDYTVNKYYETVSNVVNYRGKFIHDLSKPTGMKQKLVDISKIETWGWKAKTGLYDGLVKTYNFYLQHYRDTNQPKMLSERKKLCRTK